MRNYRDLKKGDKVKVISDCMSYGRTGVVSETPLSNTIAVRLDKNRYVNEDIRTFSVHSLEKVNDSKTNLMTEGKGKVPAIFLSNHCNIGEVEDSFIFDEYGVVVYGENFFDCLEKFNQLGKDADIDLEDYECGKVIYEGRDYDLKRNLQIGID